MITLKEVTDWDTANHTYLVNDSKDKLYAYVVDGVLRPLPRPLRFETRYRKFVTIQETFGFVEPVVVAKNSWTVEGSGGNKYVVTQHGDTVRCSCSGFKFRGNCKHLEKTLDKPVLT